MHGVLTVLDQPLSKVQPFSSNLGNFPFARLPHNAFDLEIKGFQSYRE